MPGLRLYKENPAIVAGFRRLIENLKEFLLELGKGFMFVGSQQRITLNNNHYYVDLVFYNKLLYRSLLRTLKVNQSFSKKVNPFDNAVVESFFSNIKREELNSHDFKYFEDLEKVVNDYMSFYNNYRPHESLQNKTPIK